MYYLHSSKSKSKISTAVAKLDKVFSEFIRLRDSKRFGFRAFQCISCGKVKSYEQADCGHYYSRRKMSTRFDEDNCHAECRHCNRFSADHLIGYRDNLRKKIGEERFEELTRKANLTRKWSVWELEQLVTYYKTLIKTLKNEQI